MNGRTTLRLLISLLVILIVQAFIRTRPAQAQPFASGKAEAQQAHTLGNALSACWGQVQSASVFNWKTFETDALTSAQVSQILAWDDSVKFWTPTAGAQFPADTASTFARYTLNFDTASGAHYAEVRVSGDGHAYVFPFRTTSPEGSAWHGCDDLVIPASEFTSLLPAHPERHTTPQPGDVFQCDLVYSSYPAYINTCYYAPKVG